MMSQARSSMNQKQLNLPKNYSEEQLKMMWQDIAKNKLSFILEYESYGDWKPAKHILYLTKKLEAVERGEIKRLMVFMPPRHGKSEVVTKKFPAWYLGRNPDNEVIISSYSADLAYDF